jgi:hypothetical protein
MKMMKEKLARLVDVIATKKAKAMAKTMSLKKQIYTDGVKPVEYSIDWKATYNQKKDGVDFGCLENVTG